MRLARYAVPVALVAVLPAAQAARDVAEQRECATCHIMWLKDFKREDVDTLIPYDPKPVTASGREEVTSTSAMCLSCHDGFVLDDRALWTGGHASHPVGIAPTAAMAERLSDGKNLFPLNDDGNIYCGTCHTAHGVDWQTEDAPIFMRSDSDQGGLCEVCHEDRLAGPAAGNHPVGVAVDRLPATVGERQLFLGPGNRVICQSCHAVHDAADERLLVADDGNSELCGACHTERNAGSLEAAAAAGTHPVNVVPGAAGAARRLLEQGGRLGSDGQVICSSCHTPHRADSETGILIASNHDSGLCRTCHEGESRVAGSRHDLTVTGRDEHAGAGVCRTCHLPHGGSGPKMWAREIPVGGDPLAGLCLGCHADGGSAEAHQVGLHTHPVGVSSAGDAVGLPTFSADGVRAAQGLSGIVSCVSCHDAHQWDPEDADIVAAPGVDGDAGNSFLRTANDRNSALCAECHEEKWQLENGGHDLEASLPGLAREAGAEAGMCGSCHRSHNGFGPAMWARELDAGSPPAAALCLSCHGPEGPADARPTSAHSHPVGVSIGKLGISVDALGWHAGAPAGGSPVSLEALPLYDDRGESAAAGDLVGCGSCHDPHGRSAMPAAGRGDEDRQPDRFLRLGEDGPNRLCVNCHVAEDAIRNSPHRGKESRAPAAAGICMSCHRGHDGEAEYMWARNPGPGRQPIERLCASCHRSGGEAETRLTGRHSHPVGVALDDGGVVDCANCHDPHQWDPDDPSNPAGLADAVDGDVHTSFLRIGDADGGLCLTCHDGYAEVRGTDHDLRMTAAGATNAAGQTVANSGVCGQCHVPHNALSGPGLWARELGDGGQQGEAFCSGCHVPSGVAATSVPGATGHPATVPARAAIAREALYSKAADGISVRYSGDHPGAPGEIGCASCHDPHRWKPGRDDTAPVANRDGDAQSSFLRLDSTQHFLCADCHGKDSLFRYLYFHSPRSRD
ncbi:MAG: cytochrome c3 family protein [Gammaproteobacteria bacterium]